MTIDPGSGQPVGGGQPPEAAEAQSSDRLRSMLAQAVEGQRDEQREVAGVLGDMRNQLLRLGQEIAGMRAAGGGEGVDASTVNNVTVELREAVRFLSERLDGVTRMVAQRGEELADIRGAITAIDAHVRAQAETVGMLSQGLQALPSYGERVSALQDNIDRVHQRLGEVRNVVARPTDNSQLEQRLTAIEAALAQISERDAQHSDRVAQQAAAMAEHRSSLDALGERIDSLAAGTQAALAVPPVFDDTSIQALDVQLTGLAAEIASMRSDVAALAGAGESAAAVDTSEFSTAVAEAEERMRNHVDEAVVALAEMLLRRRMPAPNFDPIDTSPITQARPVIPSMPVEEPAAAAYDESPLAYEAVTAAEPEPAASIDEPNAAADLGPDSPEWWEREDPTAIPTLPAAEQPDDELPMVDFSVASIADEDSDEADDDDVSEGPPVEPAEAYEWEPAAGPAEDLDATSEIAVLPDEAPPAPPTSYRPPTSTWAPEVPTDRPEADSVDTIVPERKKRWFRG